MIKMIFLGSGAAFSVGNDNFQSNILLIDENEEKFLIDCGSDIRFSLHKVGLSYLDITDIYISHLHSDHAGGLEYIGLSRKFDSKCQNQTTNLYLSHEIATDVWHKTLSGGMEYMEGYIATISDFFRVYAIKKNQEFYWKKIRFYPFKTNHVNSGSCLMPSQGLFFELAGKKVLLSGDTKLEFARWQNYYEEADIIFHDCETSKIPTPVHPRYQQLVNLPQNIKGKMWLYGYQTGELPDANKGGFRGFVKRGQVFCFQANSEEISSEFI